MYLFVTHKQILRDKMNIIYDTSEHDMPHTVHCTKCPILRHVVNLTSQINYACSAGLLGLEKYNIKTTY